MTRERGRLLLAGVALATAAACSRSEPPPPAPHAPTFARDIASIVWAHCAPCHRPGEAGPFSLLSYRDVAKRAKQIAAVTRTRFMPPWRPVPGYAPPYANDRSLAASDIAAIQRWVAAGAPEGIAADTPPLPTWPAGWQLGVPDLVVQMPAPYALAADGRDIYRNFVFPTQLPGSHWVAGWEMRTNGAAIHHAIVNVDRHGWARRRDAEDAEPGYPGMDPGDLQAPDGFYLVWTPGKVPSPPIAGTAWKLDAGIDLVVQLHMLPSGRPQIVQPTIGLYFTDQPPTRARITMKIGEPYIDIPAGKHDYTITDTYALPADTNVLGLFPHAHYLAKKMRVWATEPDGTNLGLLAIDDWNFAWQEEYSFATPPRLPRGTVVHMEFTYDNSADNERNPNQPPQRVTSGERSVDEMGNVTLELSPHDPADMEKLRESKYRGLVARAPNDARAHFNLANTLSRETRIDDAVAEYRTAARLDPKLAPAQFNLGNLLQQTGKSRDAIAAFEAALKAQPAFPEAELNLGDALARTGDVAGARAHITRSLELRPGYPEATLALSRLGAARK